MLVLEKEFTIPLESVRNMVQDTLDELHSLPLTPRELQTLAEAEQQLAKQRTKYEDSVFSEGSLRSLKTSKAPLGI